MRLVAVRNTRRYQPGRLIRNVRLLIGQTFLGSSQSKNLRSDATEPFAAQASSAEWGAGSWAHAELVSHSGRAALIESQHWFDAIRFVYYRF